MQLTAWIIAARPKTLPLALAGPLAALACVNITGSIHWLSASLVIITVALLQLIANLANDLGDGLRGTDDERVGPQRALASGLLSEKQIKKVLIGTGVATAITGLASLILSPNPNAWWLLALGALALWAAYAYTLGSKPYGYRALGDLAVAVFYGPVAVLGTAFVQGAQFSSVYVFVAIAQAAWAATVLHINNMRDRDSDQQNNKVTLAVILGEKLSRLWYVALVVIAALCSAFASYYFAATFLPFAIILISIVLAERTLKAKGVQFNPKLAQHALISALLSVLWLAFSLARFN